MITFTYKKPYLSFLKIIQKSKPRLYIFKLFSFKLFSEECTSGWFPWKTPPPVPTIPVRGWNYSLS